MGGHLAEHGDRDDGEHALHKSLLRHLRTKERPCQGPTRCRRQCAEGFFPFGLGF